VNIHFTQGQPGEIKALSAAYKVIRMDFAWGGIETRKGVYDFRQYDILVRDMEAAGVRPLLILDYGNNLYGSGPVRTADQRKAYTAFAVAALKHFKGRRIMWEFWNEPNGDGFWGGRPDPSEYAAMVNAAAPAMRKADPNATLLLGAFSGFPWDYIETAFRKGCLQWADAVTVHPYRSGYPESVDLDYLRLRRLIAQYSPHRDVPVISGEWGYSTNRKSGIPELRQAQYLVRQRLYNVRCGILTSIWYDWKEDGPNPDENEHHFGSTHQDFSPKPAYAAALTMTKTLAGYRYVRMLSDGPEKYAMLLRGAGGRTAVALWTTGRETDYTLPCAPEKVVSMLGGEEKGSQRVSIGPSPVYALLGKMPAAAGLACGAYLKPYTVVMAGEPRKCDVTVTNATALAQRVRISAKLDGGNATPSRPALEVGPGKQVSVPVTLDLWRRSADSTLLLTTEFTTASGSRVRYSTRVPLVVANPITASLSGPTAGTFEVALNAPGVRTAETLTVRRTDLAGKAVGAATKIRIRPGVTAYSATVPLVRTQATDRYGVKITDRFGRVVASLPRTGFVPILPMMAGSSAGSSPLGLAVHGEGDDKPGGSVSLTTATDAVHGTVADLNAEFPAGWRYYVVTPTDTSIPANAVGVGMWVNGDACGDSIRLRFIDAAGQTYQPTYGSVTWKGWRWITMRLDDPAVGSWGGVQDGVIHKPLKWDSVFLLDSALQTAHSAHVQFSGITLITR
jgi:hypothetical protein